ncbi:MAG TPA: YaaL family protein [Bacillota bacterium]|mgnify:CR=1 FL=1|jgi:hypothetical protein|nr:YaaL family protein [Bacillota bacterium]HOL08608.1 YaaL family protein [Bacillota bacterium]HPO98409.1 YaaL family protein [Bacillota bacterium]
MQAVLKNWVAKTKQLLNRFGFIRMTTQDDLLLKNLEQAKSEWNYAKLYFNSVIEPDLIDHAIYYLGATEKKYAYLLKRARMIGLSAEHYHLQEY